MSEWQPIETAPKDSYGVILFCPAVMPNDRDVVGEGYYCTISDRWWWANVDWGEYHGEPILPTHWMPLPLPPNPQGERG